MTKNNKIDEIREEYISSKFFVACNYNVLTRAKNEYIFAFNTFIQQSINVEGLPFLVTKNSKEALREQAVAILMMDLKKAEERADKEGWIDADDLERELRGLD